MLHYLVVHNELRVLVEHRVGALGERQKGLHHPLRMEVRRSGLLQVVGLCQHLAHIQGIAVVKEELQRKGGWKRERGGRAVAARKERGWGGREKGEGVGW